MSDFTQKIELWDIDKIIPYPGNAKIHPPEQIKKLAQSITKFNWTSLIQVDYEGVVIAGHGRRLAAIEMGLKKVPVIVRRDLTKAEADALRLADNRISSTDYDQEAIQSELQRLSAELDGTFELTDLGFDLKEIDFVMSDLGEINDAAFVQDITIAVEEQKVQNAKDVEDVDDIAAPVVDALGFKRVTIAQSREIRDLMAMIEDEDTVSGFIKALKRGIEA